MKLVYIVWEDHCGHPPGWKNLSQATNTPTIVHSVGWVIKEDKKYITIAGSYDVDPDSNGHLYGLRIQTLVKSCITKRKNLSL